MSLLTKILDLKKFQRKNPTILNRMIWVANSDHKNGKWAVWHEALSGETTCRLHPFLAT